MAIPDFGISEYVADKFGQGRTSQGGSDLFGNTYAQKVTQAPNNGSFIPTGSTNTNQITPSGATTGGGGQILGATTEQFNGGNNQIVEQNQPEQPKVDLYAEVGRAFDDVLGGLGGQQSGLESNIQTSANTQKTGINEQLGFGLTNLDTQRGNVRTNQANTLADLAQNLRDQAKNVNMFLGVRGAGGSANEAASFALQKLFGRERAGVQRQGMAQLGEIDTAENNLRAKASEMLNGVDTWANSQMSSIAQQFNELRNNIGMMKGQMRAQAIESLWNQYNQVQNMRQQYAMSIAQAAQDRLAQLNNLKLELQGTANFDPRSMVYNEYGFNPTSSYAPENFDPAMFNPMAAAKRKDEQA